MAFPPEIEELVQRGIAAAREQRNGVAQQLLRKAVELAPEHEQAWLWLSGVEDTTATKIAALERVLAINPNNTHAQRGLERLLEPPKPLDLAAIAATTAAPAPARAAHVPPPPPPRPAPMPEPELRRAASEVIMTEPVALTSDEPAPAAIGTQALDDLRPALARAKKRNPFIPRMSEVIIMGVLIGLFLLSLLGVRFWLNAQQNRFNVAQPAIDRSRTQGSLTPAPTQVVIIIDPTRVPAPPANNQATSRSYGAQFGGATVDEATKTVQINVTLTNPLGRVVPFSANDFSLRNSANARLSIQAGQSTLLAQGTQLAPNGTQEGVLVFSGNVAQRPYTLTWRPTGGGIQQEIQIP